MHYTPTPRLSSSTAGMDNVTNRRRTMLLQMVASGSCRFYQLSPPFSHSYKHNHPPSSYLAHKHQRKTFHTKIFQASSKPGHQKTIHATLSSVIQQKHSGDGAVREMSAAHSKTKQSADAIHYVWHTKKNNKADSEMPPRDFSEELIYLM